MRRLYQVMGRFAISLVVWLTTLLVLSVTEMRTAAFREDFYNSYTFVVLQLPFHMLVLFGCYSLCAIGYHLFILGKHLLTLV